MANSFGLFQSLGDISLGELVFNRRDASGCLWSVTDLDGWWGLPEPTVPDDTRPFTSDGSYVTTGRYGPRVITMTGQVIPPPDRIDSVIAARTALNRELNLVRRTTQLVVQEYEGARMADVQISGRPLTKIDTLNGVMTFEITLRAPDPRKYSAQTLYTQTGLAVDPGGRTYPKRYPHTYGALGTSGITSIYNPGSYESSAIIRFDGPIVSPGVEHIESGRSISFDLTLQPTDSLYLDLSARTVLLNQQESRRNTMSNFGRWFMIAPGQNSLRFSGTATDNATQAPSMTVIYRPAWIE
jgi:hypothetical protein